MKATVTSVVGLLCAAVALSGCTTAKRAGAQQASGPTTAVAVSSPAEPSAASSPSAAYRSAASSSALPYSPPATTPALAPASPAPTTAHAATPTRDPKGTPKPAPTTPAAPKPAPAPAPLLVQQLANVGNARQVVIVTSSSWTTDVATLQTFENDASGWHAVFPAMAAHIGRAGFSADKHEGDLKTPAGMYGFGVMFGQRANPGVKFPYRQADSQSVWVDDVNSPYYNTWQENAALSGEHLASSGYATAYAYAVAIAYNVNPIVRGKGSAIFLHVSTGGGTAGCVSIAEANLLQVLRWLDPAKSPVIVMGPASVIRQY